MTKLAWPCRFVDRLGDDPDYHQNVVRLEGAGDATGLILAFRLPPRQPDDRQEATERQRSVVEDFYDASVIPDDLGRRRAGLLIEIKNLAWAVAEILEQGFSVDGRVLPALLIALRIVQDPYLRSVARGVSMGASQQSLPPSVWPFLVGSAFHRELVEFWLLAEGDLEKAIARRSLVETDR